MYLHDCRGKAGHLISADFERPGPRRQMCWVHGRTSHKGVNTLAPFPGGCPCLLGLHPFPCRTPTETRTWRHPRILCGARAEESTAGTGSALLGSHQCLLWPQDANSAQRNRPAVACSEHPLSRLGWVSPWDRFWRCRFLVSHLWGFLCASSTRICGNLLLLLALG